MSTDLNKLPGHTHGAARGAVGRSRESASSDPNPSWTFDPAPERARSNGAAPIRRPEIYFRGAERRRDADVAGLLAAII